MCQCMSKKLKHRGLSPKGFRDWLTRCPFQYCLYVVIHLSKYIPLFSVFIRSMSALLCRHSLPASPTTRMY